MGDMELGFCELSLDVQLCSNGIFTADRGFLKPDNTKAYVPCVLSHSWPVVMAFGNTLHPNTIARSFQSLRDQNVNIGHMVHSYDKDNIPRDRIVGSVVSVDFPASDDGGWILGNDPTKAPGIRAVMSLFKQAAGIDRIIGQFLSGKRQWSVSVEYLYDFKESGWLVIPATASQNYELAGEMVTMGTTPDEVRKLGMWYVPWTKAPDEMLSCWNKRKARVDKDYKGAKVVLMQGGIDGGIHYMGIGLTEAPAEPTAKINDMFASKHPEVGELFKPLADATAKLGEVIKKCLT